MARRSKDSGGAGETIRTLLYAIGIALVIRTLAFEPFSVPSESMLPTLLVGDYFFISKWPYGYSRYSLPFGPPVFEGRVLGKQPQRGDVIVFQRGGRDGADYVKRLIGLPGDRVQMRNGALWINDEEVKRERVDVATLSAEEQRVARGHMVYRETMPNGATYLTLDRGDLAQDNTPVYLVPDGQYFMMGDNRDNSHDSRFPDFGMVPFEGLEGRAGLIFFSVDGSAAVWQFWKWPWAIRFGRMGDFKTL
jgi:signal peptidase I